jgi:hypothetical protein
VVVGGLLLIVATFLALQAGTVPQFENIDPRQGPAVHMFHQFAFGIPAVDANIKKG